MMLGIEACCFHPANEPLDGGMGEAGGVDAGFKVDGGPIDAGNLDAGPDDAGPSDAGAPDAGVDAGLDAGVDAGRDGGGAACLGPASAMGPIFGAPIQLDPNGGVNWWVTSGDLNGDGIEDLLQSNQNTFDPRDAGFVGVYFGLADGGFSAPLRLAQGHFAAPIDPDGGAPMGSIGVSEATDVYATNGEEIGSYFTGVYNFAVADLDGDGKPDVAFCGAQLEAIYNTGAGTFGPSRPLAQVQNGCYVLAAGDLNQDGAPDLVALGYLADYSSEQITVFINDRDGGLLQTSYLLGSGHIGGSVVLADLNGDGLLDIVAAGDPDFHVLLNLGGGQFGNAASYPTWSQGGFPLLAVADFNGDCWPDVATTTFGSGECAGAGPSTILLFLNLGDGTFSGSMPIDSGLPTPNGVAAYMGTGAQLSSIAVADGCSGQFEILPNLTKP